MSYLKSAGFVLLVYGVIALVQTKGMQLPVIGEFLPGGKPTAG